jgi:hypothetical protein
MTFVNRIITDLREKRLWPVALVLLGALIAVPALLANSSKPLPVAQVSPAAGVSQPAAQAATALPAVSVQSTASISRLGGRARDPFTQQSVPASGGATGSGASAGGSSSSGSSAGGSGAAHTSTTPSGATPSGPSTPSDSSTTPSGGSGATYVIYTVDLSFGKAGRAAHDYRNVPRLAPFPSPGNPVMVFLGVKSDAKTVEFLITSTASPTGGGKCAPAHGQCELLSLAMGQTERLMVLNWNGTVTNYVLKVSAVHTIPTSSPADANLAHARVSAAGQRIFRQAQRQSSLLQSVSYSADTGLLSVNTPPASFLAHLGRLSAGAASGILLSPVSGK